MAGYPHRRSRREQPAIALQPVDYRGLSDRARIERLSGWSLERTEEVLSIPLVDVLSHPQCALLLSAQGQMVRAVWNMMVKTGLDNRRLEDERERILADLSKREFGEDKQ